MSLSEFSFLKGNIMLDIISMAVTARVLIDCLHLQLYRDSKDRYKKGQTKASLSLQHFLGYESGFTLDKESNTIAIICQDIIVVLAFDTRERLIQWQVKISNNLGEGQQYLILISSAPSKAKVSSGPAKLHVQDHRFCMTAGVPPRLVGMWEIGHLRRYGVVEGRFCFEGGSRCGKGEGLYVLITDQGEEITQTFNLASQGKLSMKRRPQARKMSTTDSPIKQGTFRPDTRLSDLNPMETSQVIVELNRSVYGDMYASNIEDSNCGAVSPYWPSAESQSCRHNDVDSNYGCGDTTSVSDLQDGGHHETWAGGGGMVTLERCMSCISKLGAMSRSSTATAAMTPCATGPYFNPVWTMECVKEKPDYEESQSVRRNTGDYEYSVPKLMKNGDNVHKAKTPVAEVVDLQGCQCQNCPPSRPPKPSHLDTTTVKCKKMPMPLPQEPQNTTKSLHRPEKSKVGPYENYDVPKIPFEDTVDYVNDSHGIKSEYYDTPKNLSECLSTDAFQLTTSIAPGVVTLKRPCGCILKFGKKQIGPKVIIDNENIRPADCPCQRVTNWANNWISFPYCRKNITEDDIAIPIKTLSCDLENKLNSNRPAPSDLYATVDFTKKTNRRPICQQPNIRSKSLDEGSDGSSNYINIVPTEIEKCEDNDCGNYANLDFALSLEHYENAKDLLRKAGVTPDELDVITSSLNRIGNTLKSEKPLCAKCGHHQIDNKCELEKNEHNDDYLMMEPSKSQANEFRKKSCHSGYTPMSPISNSHTLRTSTLNTRINKIVGEKSASNPALCGPPVDRSKKRCDSEMRIPGSAMLQNVNSPNSPYIRKQLMDSTDSIITIKNRKRSSSADSSRFLEDVKEFDGSIGSRTTSSSLETLRNINVGNRRSSSPCIHQETEICTNTICCGDIVYEIQSTHADGDVTPNGIPLLRNKLSESSQIRRSSSVPCKSGQNRDSSSSNDSGVSSCSLKHRGGDFIEFELPLTTAMSTRRHYYALAQKQIKGQHVACTHATLPRRSKSSDPLRELTFQIKKSNIPAKSSSAEAEVPICPSKTIKGVIDSHSTSSGASDMSDYIETLSLSSHSSTDTTETLRINRNRATATLRPRSGKEYHSIDAHIISSSYQNMNKRNEMPNAH